jgi:MFS family permease
MALPAALAPLRHPTFRLLWLANLVANTGMWMQNTAAGWLMTSLAPSPMMVSLVQVASLLPVFLLALPAGALADILDRRLYLIGTQAWVAASALLLALLTFAGLLGPWGLLALTFAIGAGTAMNSPAWAATTPETVPRADLTQAIVLNGIGFNLTRAVGPALGGFLVAAFGPAVNFALNAIAFCVVIVALVAWKREQPRQALPQEHFLSAIRSGLGFVRASPVLRATMLRGIVFFTFAAVVWSVLPLLVRQQLGLGPEWFGILLGAMGVGAVGAGFLQPSFRTWLDRQDILLGASLLAGFSLAMLGQAGHWAVALVAMLGFGVAWLTGASMLQAAAQLACPPWVRARAIGIYQLGTFGALALGALLGGWGGEALGLPWVLGLAGLGCAGGGIAVRKLRLDAPAAAPAPATAPPAPEPADPALAPLLARERNQVMELVLYTVPPDRRAGFLAAMREVRYVRLRAGARDWRLFEDIAHPDRWVEAWVVENWTEHLREAGRLTEADRSILARASSFHAGETPPEAARYLNVMPDMT